MTIPEITLIGLAALCGTCLLVLVVLSVRQVRWLRSLGSPLQAADADRLADLVAGKTARDHEDGLARLSDQMDSMRRDFEWLVSDRMIQQAVDMARTGESPDTISHQTGISTAELDAIRKLRH